MDKVTFEDFEKFDFRVGRIISAREHPKADKLFILEVDLGEGATRTIVAGLRGYYSVKELEGRQAIFAANLESATLRGVASDGMILAATMNDNDAPHSRRVVILQPEKEIENGSRVS